MTWITTDNVSAEAWRHLLEYANNELALEAIIKKHGAPDNKSLHNYKKQAQQLRASILQAKDYFNAAENSTLITSPNHLYYGMVSLCSAIMLLLGNGDKALDKLRLNKDNKHHGLDFSTDINATSCRVGLNILTNSFISIRNNGFFLQWHSTLPKESPVFGVFHEKDDYGTSVNRLQFGTDRFEDSTKIINYKSSLLELLQYLPDLILSLENYGVNVPFSRVDMEINHNSKETFHELKWRIHGATSAKNLLAILDEFKVPEEEKDKLVKHITNNGKSCIVKFKAEKPGTMQFPSSRETINNEKIIYGKRQMEQHEIVDAYLSAYGLSMLSRYFPDIWVSCLESHCKAAQLIERLVFILIKKAPVMTLAIMHEDDFVISTHRPPWH